MELDDAAFSLEGVVEPLDGGYELRLTVRTSSGATERILAAEDCGELGAAAALVLAVALDPFRIPEPPAPVLDPEPEPPEPEPPSPAVAPMPTGDVPPAPPRTRPPVRGGVVVAGLAGRGISPRVDGRLQIGGVLDVAWLRLEVLGFHAFKQRIAYDATPGVGADISGFGGSVRVGPRVPLGPVELACPIGVELAAVRGSGFGARRNWRDSQLRWGGLIAPALRVSLGRHFAVGADVELDVAARRPAFAVDTLGAVYRTPRLGVRGGLRVEARFSGARGDQPGPSRRRR